MVCWFKVFNIYLVKTYWFKVFNIYLVKTCWFKVFNIYLVKTCWFKVFSIYLAKTCWFKVFNIYLVKTCWFKVFSIYLVKTSWFKVFSIYLVKTCQGFSQDFETISHFCGTDFYFKLWINKNIMSLILESVTLPYWLVMEIENLLGWEHILQINNLNTTQIVIPPPPPPPPFEILLCFGLIPHKL